MPTTESYQDWEISCRFMQGVSVEAHLSHSRVQVVHDHQHDGGRLTGTARILVNGVGSEIGEVNSNDY